MTRNKTLSFILVSSMILMVTSFPIAGAASPQCEPLTGLCASVSVDAQVADFSKCANTAKLTSANGILQGISTIFDAPTFHECFDYGGLGTVTNGALLPVTGSGAVTFTGSHALPLVCQGIGGCTAAQNAYAITYDGVYCVAASFSGFTAITHTGPATASKGSAC